MTNPRNLTNLRGLQAFEAVARHKSVTLAGRELGLTQSAVSHQIRRLSIELGEKLIEKSGRSIAVTEAGRRLAEELHAAFGKLELATRRAIRGGPETLRLAICSAFSTGWMIHRMDDFAEKNPDIDIQLRMYAEDPELTDRVADAFVTGWPTQAGYSALPLLRECLVAVRRVEPHGRETRNDRLPLITTELDSRTLGDDWVAYCQNAGLELRDLYTGRWLQCSHYILALELAREGLGIALVPDFLAASDIEAGRLALLSPARMPTGQDYFLCVKTARRNEAPLRTLIGWFKATSPGIQ
jgi:LysR family glycine cleavage system transcriptional activator